MTIPMTLPDRPHIGLQFRPDTTDSIGTITELRGLNATYSYAHAPEVEYSRPYGEIRRLGWPVAK